MDVSRFTLDRLSTPRPPLSPAAASDPVAVLAWLPRVDADGRPLTWTARDARRFVFARYLRDTGRVSDER